MIGKTCVIYTDGTKYFALHEEPLTLDWMQGMVGGSIEQVPLFNKFMDWECVAFFNEDGKRLDLPVNIEATEVWRRQTHTPIDLIRGDILIVAGDREFMEAL